MTVTLDQIKLLVGPSQNEITDDGLLFFINIGRAMINGAFIRKYGNGGVAQFESLDLTIKNLIELYITGHAYVLSIEGGGITYTKSGNSEEKYKSFGFDSYGFQTTRFGAMACSFDPTGTLAAASTKGNVSAEFESVGFGRRSM
jgi:hypothetical protein